MTRLIQVNSQANTKGANLEGVEALFFWFLSFTLNGFKTWALDKEKVKAWKAIWDNPNCPNKDC